MGAIEGKGGATLGAGAARGQRRASGKLAELASDLTGAVGGDRDLVVEPVPATTSMVPSSTSQAGACRSPMS